MKPHPRIRKTIKWGGGAVTVLLVVAWIGSGWFSLDADSGWNDEIRVWWGRLEINIAQDRSAPVIAPRHWHFGELTFMGTRRPRWPWWFRCGVDMLGSSGPPQQRVVRTSIEIPLWTIAGAALFITTIAWRLDTLARHRARLNLCPKCNYDRAGIAGDAKCPECGAIGGVPTSA